jgi:multidrug efflux pump subunit AcrA (membrane-fusion protein)
MNLLNLKKRLLWFITVTACACLSLGTSRVMGEAKEPAGEKGKEEHKHEEGEGAGHEGHDHDHDHGNAAAQRAANTVVLTETGVQNLRIETAEAEEGDFEETIFALGRIEVLPGKKAIVSSRIPGRAFSVLALPDQEVDQGEELMWVESRQPGDPPPTVMLGAPIAGTIAKVNISQGQPIEANDSLIEIVNLDSVEAAAQVSEHLAGKLKKGQKARIRIAGFPDKVFEAELAHLGVHADGEKGTVEAAFHVPNPDKLLRPGMRAEFSILVNTRSGVVSVPRSALQGEPSNRFVYVKDFDLPNAFVKTPVVVGEMNDRLVEVINGLLPADEVVTRGAYSLSFAGASSVSLKEALDAAHGHEHAADGSELTPEKKAEMEAAKKKAGGAAAGSDGGASPIWMYSTIVLAVMLVASLFMRKRTPDAEPAPTPKPVTKEAA